MPGNFDPVAHGQVAVVHGERRHIHLGAFGILRRRGDRDALGSQFAQQPVYPVAAGVDAQIVLPMQLRDEEAVARLIGAATADDVLNLGGGPVLLQGQLLVPVGIHQHAPLLHQDAGVLLHRV